MMMSLTKPSFFVSEHVHGYSQGNKLISISKDHHQERYTCQCPFNLIHIFQEGTLIIHTNSALIIVLVSLCIPMG